MKQDNKISVIIPVYNVEKYLSQCLDSVINQTYKNLEIICVNDGSTDNSLDILNEYALIDKRIKVISQKNKGLSGARNKGMELATGKYIAFLDSDDWVENNFYEKLYYSAELNNADCAIGNTLYYWDDNNIKDDCWVNYYLFKDNKILIESIQDRQNIIYSCAVWNKLYKTDIIKKYNLSFAQDLFIEDLPFTFAFSILANKFVMVKDASLFYRQHSETIMANIFKSNRIFDIFKIYEICDNFLDKLDIDSTQKNEYDKILSNFKIFNLYAYYSGCEEEYKKTFERKLIDVFNKIEIKNNNYITGENRAIYKKVLCNKFLKFMLKLLSQIFSISNDYHDNKKYKVLKILGIKIKFQRKVKYEDFYELNSKIDAIEHSHSEKLEQLKNKNYLYNNAIQALLECSEIPNEPIAYKTNNRDENVKAVLDEIGEFYFLPNKGNLGDLLIAFSEFQYFESHKLNYKVFDIDNRSNYSEPFNFVYGGGGLWHPLYRNDYRCIIDVFKSKLLKKCVVLPSSFYECDDVIEVFDERFTVFCREKQSYDYCVSKNQKAKFILADDMVINADFDILKTEILNKDNVIKNTLYPENIEYSYENYTKAVDRAINAISKYNNFEVGYLMREDRESVSDFSSELKIDPSGFIGSYACDNALNTLSARIFLTTIDQFDIVVTDRLHISIVAAKLGKKVLMLDNSYKKLSNVYENSLQNYSNVKLTTLNDLENDIINCKKEINENNKNPKMSLEKLSLTLPEFMIQYNSLKNDYGYERTVWI